MISHDSVSYNSFPTAIHREFETFQIHEASLKSQSHKEFKKQTSFTDVHLFKYANDFGNVDSQFSLHYPILKMDAKSYDLRQKEHIDLAQRSMSFDSIFDEGMNVSGKFGRKKSNLRLPSFSELGIASRNPVLSRTQSALIPYSPPNTLPVCKYMPDVFDHLTNESVSPKDTSRPSLLDAGVGIVPLLTPPEETYCFQWAATGCNDASTGIKTSSTGQEITGMEAVEQQAPLQMARRPTEISLPTFIDLSSERDRPSTWLERSIAVMVSSLYDATARTTQVQMVVQALPSQIKTPNAKPTFQQVVEKVQEQSADVPYITITHAVSQVMSMEEVPASPPATPNMLHQSDDYFENQTVFTHAAVVPNYHTKQSPSTSVSARTSSIITAPSSVNICLLERYIPPTSTEEMQDFFSISRRSYLVDRLTELSVANGTLLLIYPTKTGGTTFAKRYIGPVIDPFLRQFVLLNDLTSHAAAALGRMASIGSMVEFDEMRRRLEQLCDGLTRRAPSRGMQSAYSVVRAETTEVTLDRTTWLEWFLEQEQGRLRQDLIDYQKSGGRMPRQGFGFDSSPGLLARAVVAGIRSSTEAAGGVGIEVGVFVIRRSSS